MTLQERCELVLTFARVLHVDGQSTHETMVAAEQLSNKLGLHATFIPGWGQLEFQATDGSASLVAIEAASPTGVDMNRVASAMDVIDEVVADRLAPSTALDMVRAIEHAPPVPAWLFTLA